MTKEYYYKNLFGKSFYLSVDKGFNGLQLYYFSSLRDNDTAFISWKFSNSTKLETTTYLLKDVKNYINDKTWKLSYYASFDLSTKQEVGLRKIHKALKLNKSHNSNENVPKLALTIAKMTINSKKYNVQLSANLNRLRLWYNYNFLNMGTLWSETKYINLEMIKDGYVLINNIKHPFWINKGFLN